MEGGAMKMQVNAANLPLPSIVTHSMAEPKHTGQMERGGVKRAPHPLQRDPISFSSAMYLL
jgi:hypothetical protein